MKPRRYRSYAKINLYLDVLDRRPDGFTNIETVFQSIDLWDELMFTPRATGTDFSCNNPALANPDDNLVGRAVALVRARTGTTQGVAIHLDKRVPVAAGLAGGSGNAAATLVALNQLWELGLTSDMLAEMALELGSDVPFCLAGGTMAAVGRGEALERLPDLPPQWLVLVHPPLEITAGYAYGHPQLTRNTTVPVGGKTPAFTKALAALAAGRVADTVFNRMESGVLHDYPELAAIKVRLTALGCAASAMSGSGPTVFGLCASETQARTIGQEFTDYPVSVLQTTARGVSQHP